MHTYIQSTQLRKSFPGAFYFSQPVLSSAKQTGGGPNSWREESLENFRNWNQGETVNGGRGVRKFFLILKKLYLIYTKTHEKQKKKVTTEIQKGHLQAKNCKTNILEINKRGVLIKMVDKKRW